MGHNFHLLSCDRDMDYLLPICLIFFQIRHALNIENGSLQELTPSKIVAILNNLKQDKQKVISKLYHIFIDCSVVNTDNVRQKLEQDLNMEIQTEDWSYICRQVHKCSSYNLRHKLALFKIIHRIYYTPEKLCKMNSEMSFLCWCCKKQKKTFFHIF